MTDDKLVLDDRTKIYWGSSNGGRFYAYTLETRYGISTREINLYHNLLDGEDQWYGDMIAFGENWNLDADEIEQCREFLREKGYL